MSKASTLTTGSIESFQSFMREQGMSTNTVRAYGSDLRTFLRWSSSDGVSHPSFRAEATAWLNETRSTVAPKTTIRRMTSLKMYAKWARIKKADRLSEYRLPSKQQAAPHPLPEGIEGVRLMCRRAGSVSNAALFAMQGMLGMRVSEALSMEPSSFDVAQRTVKIRGKGDKERTIPLTDEAWTYIQPAYTAACVAGTKVVNLPDRTARHNVKMVGKRLGLQRDISSHDLRATAATALLKRTGNIRMVQEFLGHANLNTTQLYLGVTLDDMREGMQY